MNRERIYYKKITIKETSIKSLASSSSGIFRAE